MKTRFPFFLPLVVALCTPLGAQNVWTNTYTSYDEQTGEVWGYASMDIEYIVGYYYDSRLDVTLRRSSGYPLDSDYEVGIMYETYHYVEVSSTNTRPGDTYTVEGKYRLDVRYQDDYYWWDYWGFGFWPPLNIDAWDSFTFYGDGVEEQVPNKFLPIGKTHSADDSNCGCTCSTPVSYSKWTQLQGDHPHLERCHMCQLEDNPNYNCIAWTVGDKSRIYNFHYEVDTNHDGKTTVAECDAFYANKQITGIAYYGNANNGDVYHVAKKSGGNGPNCQATSKLALDILISHMLSELEGGLYGDIIGGN